MQDSNWVKGPLPCFMGVGVGCPVGGEYPRLRKQDWLADLKVAICTTWLVHTQLMSVYIR